MRRKCRALITAVLLGLPSALLAHGMVFGGGHAAGGTLSTIVLGGAVFAVLLIAALHSTLLTQGSVLAARLRAQLPSYWALAASSSGWFALIELSESSHAVPVFATCAALAAACCALRALVELLSRAFAAVVLVLCALGRHRVAAAANIVRSGRAAAPPCRPFAHTRRLFSRPPPAFS